MIGEEMELQRDRLAPWLAFFGVPGLGRSKVPPLILKFGTPTDVFWAAKHATEKVLEVSGIGPSLVEKIKSQASNMDPYYSQAENILRGAFAIKVSVLHPGSYLYPALLRESGSPFPVVFVRGSYIPDCLATTRTITLVGDRDCRARSVVGVRALSEEATRKGWIVQTRLTPGIDTMAHYSSLESGGKPLAVIDRGFDKSTGYDYHFAIHHGAVLSPLPLAEPVSISSSLSRDLCLAGMSSIAIIVQARAESPLIDFAKEVVRLKRSVYAFVPPEIEKDAPEWAGNTLLLKEGIAKGVDAPDYDFLR